MIRKLFLAALAAAAASGALAQPNYPTKAMRWLVPYAAGGGTDAIVRPIALKASELLGQSVVYENRGGAGGMIAAEIVARSAPDGYTFLVVAPNTTIFATLLHKKVPYDPVKDFAMITKFDLTPNVLIAHPNFPPNTAKEMVAYAKANPGKINFASSGAGSGGHLSILLLQDAMNLDVLHVPYKGAGPAVLEVLAGRNHLMFINPAVAMPHYKAGRVKVLGFAGPKRLGTMPDVPTFDEQGFVDFESSNFKGLAAPAGTPRAIIDKMREVLVKVVNMPEITARLIAGGSIPRTTTPEEFTEENRREVERWGKLMKKHGILRQ
ncbi:MAG: tripartite tricarboxylate transporter substrate binding protein [Betaproteobacteria bacterium]|nr:tripartite tricarboxylate transporter substrate binding protein [Betaproteobacteria bacterium]